MEMEIPKYELNKKTKPETNDSPEKTLDILAYIVLVLGLVITVMCLFAFALQKTSYSAHVEFNESGLVITLVTLLSTLITSSVMHVIAEISRTLKEINKKM